MGSLTEVSKDIKQEMNRVFTLQKESQWKVKASSSTERIALLNKLRDSLLNHREEFAQALYEDLGRPLTPDPTIGTEVDMVLADIEYTVNHLEDWMKTEYHSSDSIPGAQYYVKYEPRGVALLLGPWNFPVSLTFSPLVALLAAGNCTIVKPNELTPASSEIIAKVINEVFDESVVSIFTGGVKVAVELQELPFDHMFLTGSPNVGKAVMSSAAKHLSSVTLELGGRCPLILDETADIKAIAQNIGLSKSFNSGQICLSVNHVYVPRSKREELIDELKSYFEEKSYENGVFQAERVGRIVNERNFERISGYLTDAEEKGAQIVFGGAIDREKLSIEPTILVDVPLDSKMIENEIFGPLLPIITYDDISEVTNHINAGGKPLAMYIFSNRDEFVDSILNNTSCGGVTVNGWVLHGFENALPFGGVNESGIGAYHGVHGFKELSHARSIFKVY